MAKKKITTEGFNEIPLYTTPNGKVKVEIYLQNETIWLTQQKIADLFGEDRTVVTKHLANIYTERELTKEATSAKIAQVQMEGKRAVNKLIEYYNLNAIILPQQFQNNKKSLPVFLPKMHSSQHKRRK